MKLRPNRSGGLSLLVLSVTLLAIPFSGCVKLAHRSSSNVSQFATPDSSTPAGDAALVNINTASAAELEKLPGIGRALAARIVSFREQYGSFRRPEHLIMVRGIGERRFRRLRPFITA
jgi:competence ComEA-like helix-hairpin-helix protein